MADNYCQGCAIYTVGDECPRCFAAVGPKPTKIRKRRVKKPLPGSEFGRAQPSGVSGPIRDLDLIVSRDPGQSAYVCVLDPRVPPTPRKRVGQYLYVLPTICSLTPQMPDLIGRRQNRIALVSEGQWLKGNAKKRVGILTLSKRANLWLGYHTGVLRCLLPQPSHVNGHVLPVDVWKSCLFDGANRDRYVHYALIERLMLDSERAMLPKGESRWDALAAVGISWASWLLGDLTQWREI